MQQRKLLLDRGDTPYNKANNSGVSIMASKSVKDIVTDYWHNNPLSHIIEVAREYPIHLSDVPGNKVVIVATRAPKSPLSGGMAPAVKQACDGFDLKFWYAYGTIEPEGRLKRAIRGAMEGYHNKTVPVTAFEVEGFRVRQVIADAEKWDSQYNRYCNQVVWPVCHNLNGYSKDLEVDDVGGNYGANETIGRRIVQDLNGDKKTPIWIHDYHHLPLANTLRNLGVENPIVYFHHIPLPTLETLVERDDDGHKHFRQMLNSLRACDAALFQTEEVAQRFYKIVGLEAPDSIPAYSGDFIKSRSNPHGQVFIGHAPISINTEKEMRIAQDPVLKTQRAKDLDSKLVADNIFINFERCDYSKGILPRVKAFEQLMEERPDLRGKAQLVLGAEPTRGGIREYEQYADDVREVVSRINARKDLWAKGQEPIIFSNHNIDHDDVVRLMRSREGQRRIGLVTPHEDGMNLTAKEFAAAQDLKHAGPLVLSSGAGTAAELNLGGKGALVYPKIANGHVEELVSVMARSIDMPQDEANARAQTMQTHLKEYDIGKWAAFTKGIFESIQRGTFEADFGKRRDAHAPVAPAPAPAPVI
jgi:trehalose 6-phosphate synthase